jgi:hypothetical protein
MDDVGAGRTHDTNQGSNLNRRKKGHGQPQDAQSLDGCDFLVEPCCSLWIDIFLLICEQKDF